MIDEMIVMILKKYVGESNALAVLCCVVLCFDEEYDLIEIG